MSNLENFGESPFDPIEDSSKTPANTTKEDTFDASEPFKKQMAKRQAEKELRVLNENQQAVQEKMKEINQSFFISESNEPPKE